MSKPRIGLPLAAPWKQFSSLEKMSLRELNKYQDTLRVDPESLTDLQWYFLENHVQDLVDASKKTRTGVDRAKASPGYALARSLAKVVIMWIRTFMSNPVAPLTDPVNWSYAIFAYSVIYACLCLYAILSVIGSMFGLPEYLKYLRFKYGKGQSSVSWSNIGFYEEKTSVVRAALPALSGPAPRPAEMRLPIGRNSREDYVQEQRLVFNVDLAKALVLMASMVYERVDEFVKLAVEHPEEGSTYLLRSEALMYTSAKEWGIEFTSISDFETVSGPFVGAFYKINDIGDNNHPFIVIVVKGTSPDNLAEWVTDGTCNLENAGDWLGAGAAHEGFYTSLFPAPSKDVDIQPYARIMETVKLIAASAAATYPERKTNLFVAGHSLGAGMASLLYARLLDSPADVGERVIIRDAYLFGTPRACAAQLVDRVEHNLRRPENYGRTLWRVSNRGYSRICGDVVTRVPPGLADDRHMRSLIKDGSLLSYGAVGIPVDITPHMAPYYNIGPVPVGQEVVVVKGTRQPEDEDEVERGPPKTPIDWFCFIASTLVPIMYDHSPTEYYRSLLAIQAGLLADPVQSNAPAAMVDHQTNVSPKVDEHANLGDD